MPSNELLEMAAPLIGQEVSAYKCLPIVTARCLCAPDNAPFILRGVEHAVVCAKCRRTFKIVAVRFDQRTGQALQAEVACVGLHSKAVN